MNDFVPVDPAHPTTDEIPFIYPAHWEADVVLRDGATAHLRPVLPTDRVALETMYAGQSEKTIYLRFFGFKPKLSDKELTRFTTVNHNDRVAFVLFLGEEMIGIGRYDRSHIAHEAEVAFMISDAHQGRGIGSILLEHLAAAAHERGINRFTAEVLPENRKMLNVFKDAGYEVQREFDDGFVYVQFDIDPTEKSRQVMEAREHRAEALSISELLAPEHVVVMGDSARWERTGEALLTNITEVGFTGRVSAYATHPVISQYEVTADFSSLTPAPDLAIINTAIEEVPAAVELCGRAGVRGALIQTKGYADDGARGSARQKSIVRLARSYGMRIIGPASFGLINTHPDVRLDTTPTEKDPVHGSLGLFSQSAGLGLMLSNSAVRRGIGVSSLVSAGNRADVSGNDLMQYWEDDPATRACGLFLESIGNPRKFSRIARRLARIKPVIVAKNVATGSHLPPGHSGRTSIAPAQALDAMFRQSGVISAESSEQLLDVAQIIVSQPLPAGRRVAVLSNAFALGQILVDRAQSLELEVKTTESTLHLESDGLDILREVLISTLESSDVDAAFTAFLPVDGVDVKDIARVLYECSQVAGKPVVASFTGADASDKVLRGIWRPDPQPATDSKDETTEHTEDAANGLPCFESPAQSVTSMAAIMDYARWRSSESGIEEIPEGILVKDARATLAELTPQGEELVELSQEQTHDILGFYGVELMATTPFSTEADALAAVETVGGYPVVLKTTDKVMAQRIDLGGVRLGIENDEQLIDAIDQMHRALAPFGTFELAVQKQAPGGQTAIIRAIEDPLLGPVISYGMTGDATTLLDDWAHRIPPLTARDVHEMVRAPKAAQKLLGTRGIPAVNIELLEDVIVRIATLKNNHPEVAEIELSPVMVTSTHLSVVAGFIKVGNPQQRTDSARRTMSS
ncbi:bifunctional GNAT family N-acetyltransferase/acetate--CoA ligase family protein [Rothia sp. ZJ932]|uniref:bifunctional acetate--CoA ligase family protein/GNAT family N-acetyltransferase n=1 Tax=Rothia sp. ZJ932 TaxID=2810516 RepID=UPI00196717DF|nr:bifunctional GNAT family N-acetyltransferase/acetate--CoA ligase family protein [Rothia sp. ZJ932]QRZ60892.1 GNAT family N-acetyltransferase [Rothia sp. ZJ932]